MRLEQQLRLIEMLGLCLADFQRLDRIPYAHRKEELKALKARARGGLRRQARYLHPDVNEGDAQKTELFALLGRLVQEIEAMEIRPRRQDENDE